jgi:ubiquitin
MASPLPAFAQSDETTSLIPLRRVSLPDLTQAPRMYSMAKSASYYACTQYEYRPFSWSGGLVTTNPDVKVAPTGYVPMFQRRPSSRLNLAKVIVDRLTEMTFGQGRFPRLEVPGDSEATDWLRALAKEGRMLSKMIELRNKGGARGSACLSWGFVGGQVRIDVHAAEQVNVLEWADYDRRRPAKAIKSYKYQRRVFDPRDGKPKMVTFFYVRYWDQTIDVVWDAIPEVIARSPKWSEYTEGRRLVTHNQGFCPVYWCQNIPDSDSVDGLSDYAGQEESLEELDELASSVSTGAKATAQPTVVIKEEPGLGDDEPVRTGAGWTIYAKGGADYLEINGQSIKAVKEWIAELKQAQLDQSGVVLLDPQKAGGTAMAASAMKQRYAVMMNRADIFRAQYGELLQQVCEDMLKTSQALNEGDDDNQAWSRVKLPPRIEYVEVEPEEDEEGEAEVKREREPKEVKRSPGKSTQVTLSWPPYFQAGWEDRKMAIDAVRAATGNKAILSQRTAVASVADLFGVTDVDAELGEMDADAERGATVAQKAFGAAGPEEESAPVAEEEETNEEQHD